MSTAVLFADRLKHSLNNIDDLKYIPLIGALSAMAYRRSTDSLSCLSYRQNATSRRAIHPEVTMDKTRTPNQPEQKPAPQDPQQKRSQGENELKAKIKADAQQQQQTPQKTKE